MSKIKSLINDIKDHAVSIKGTLESERSKQLNAKILELKSSVERLEIENRQLKSLLGRVIEDLNKENKRNRELLKSLKNF